MWVTRILSGDNDNNTEKLESYTLLNFYVHYKPTFGRLHLTVFAGVENLTDAMYSSSVLIMCSIVKIFPRVHTLF